MSSSSSSISYLDEKLRKFMFIILTSRLAPFSIKIVEISKEPIEAAICNGLCPFLLITFTSAPMKIQ